MDKPDQIEGRNPVLEALRAGRPLNRIMVAHEMTGPLGAALSAAHAAGVPVIRMDPAVLDRMAQSRNHQGIIALAAPKEYLSYEDLIAQAASAGHLPIVLLLDGIEDPQNLGALIRTAEAMGVNGVILPERRAAGLTATVERASAGALEYMPVCRVTNLTRTMADLKDRGYWLIGADPEAASDRLPELNRPVGLVLGNEGRGLHRLVREECDFLVSLPMYGKVNSLNVSAAGAILLHEMARALRA